MEKFYTTSLSFISGLKTKEIKKEKKSAFSVFFF